MKERKPDIRGIKTVVSIVRTGDVLNRYLELELAKHGSSPIRFGVMNALFVHGGTMTPTAISKWTFRAKHTISSMLHVLETIGYIRREPKVNDSRSVNIVIAEQGWRATVKMIPISEEINHKVLSCFDDAQIETLMNLLRQLRKHLFKQIDDSISTATLPKTKSR
jgi:DNA-binding MarR family transcriptional regulator